MTSIPKDAHILIIGAMKCGTTSLFHYLAQHPQICPAIQKEPEFFTRHQDNKIQVNRYEDLWNFDPRIHRYALEASVGYTKYPREQGVPEGIYTAGLRPKLIYIVRDPFERIVSHLNFMRRDPTWKLAINDPHLLSVSNYFLQLEQYRPYFPSEDILILDFEQLANEPEQLLKQVYQFLGLSQEHLPQRYPAFNTSQVPISARPYIGIDNQQLVMQRPSRQRPYSIHQLRLTLPDDDKKQKLTSEQRELIHGKLRDDMLRFQEQYRFDVGKWGFA